MAGASAEALFALSTSPLTFHVAPTMAPCGTADVVPGGCGPPVGPLLILLADLLSALEPFFPSSFVSWASQSSQGSHSSHIPTPSSSAWTWLISSAPL